MKEVLNLNLDQSLFDYQIEPVADKSILITGGTTGIGRATAILLASQGARVMIFGRQQNDLDEAMKDIREAGGEVLGLTADVSDPQDIQRVFQEFDQQMDKLDILINNAALGYGSVMEGGYPEWEYILKTNLLGYMAMTHEAAERMSGDVLLQKTTPISDTDSLGSVYFDRLFPMGVEAMLEAVDLVKAGKAPRIKQDDRLATYEGRCTADNARIDWGKPWRQIHNLIRGCSPAPGAWTTHDGHPLQVFEAQPLPARDPKGIAGKMGEVVEVSTDGFTVVCADGRIKVLRVKTHDGPKVAAGEFAATSKLAVGTRFT